MSDWDDEPDFDWRDKFWEKWSANFPVTVEPMEAIKRTGTPEGLWIKRAGASVCVTFEELRTLGLTYDPDSVS